MLIFEEVGITAKDFDNVIEQINCQRLLFRKLGLFKHPNLRQLYLNKVKDIVAEHTLEKEYTVCVAAVCTLEIQPYVHFFRYNNQGILQRYNENISRIECKVTQKQALELDAFRGSTKSTSEKGSLVIKVKEIRKGSKKYELLSYYFIGQNLNLDLNKLSAVAELRR